VTLLKNRRLAGYCCDLSADARCPGEQTLVPFLILVYRLYHFWFFVPRVPLFFWNRIMLVLLV
jgi:hypothetical protein